MNNVSGAGLNGIYTRLNGINRYHPFETVTFSDWTTGAGDIVKVKCGDDEYDSPVHTSRLVWKGAPQISLSSTGNQKREALSKVGKKKYRGGSGGLRNEEYIYREFTSSDGMLWSSIYMSASQLQTLFTNGISSVSSKINQTAEEISASIWGENSSIYSQLKMTATNIMSTVGGQIGGVRTQIEQTQSMIKSSVWTANSTLFNYIEQTASYILGHVGERSGSKVISSETEPTDPPYSLSPGDLWIEGNLINTWDDFKDMTWTSNDQPEWLQLQGQKIHVWKEDRRWHLVEDGTKFVEDTWFIRTKDTIGMMAANLETVNKEVRKNVARLEVKADSISSTVTQHTDRLGELGSNITQTATQIRSEVHAANSTLYSAIEQTATQIRSQVANTVSGLQSTITQNADKISMVVESTASGYKVKRASIVAAINNGTSSVDISADQINLNGYVKSTDITSDYLYGIIAALNKVSVVSLTSERGGIAVYTTSTNSLKIGGGNWITDCIASASVSNNTLTLTKASGGTVTFSKATTLSGAWGGGEFTVSASPQGDTCKTALNSGSISRSGRNVSIPVRATINGGSQNYATGFNATGTITAAKSDISAQRGSRNPSEPSADERLAKCSLNGWYVVTVSVLGATKTYKFQVEV